jgi:hypothetical protein
MQPSSTYINFSQMYKELIRGVHATDSAGTGNSILYLNRSLDLLDARPRILLILRFSSVMVRIEEEDGNARIHQDPAVRRVPLAATEKSKSKPSYEAKPGLFLAPKTRAKSPGRTSTATKPKVRGQKTRKPEGSLRPALYRPDALARLATPALAKKNSSGVG